MTTSPQRMVTPERRRRENRLIATTLAFVAIGPPIGGLTGFLFDFFLFFPYSRGFYLSELPEILLGAFYVMLSSYIIGVIPAGLAGALVAYASISGRFSWPLILLIGFVVGCAWMFAYLLLPAWSSGAQINDRLLLGALKGILICVIPTLICAALVRQLELKWCPISAAADRHFA